MKERKVNPLGMTTKDAMSILKAVLDLVCSPGVTFILCRFILRARIRAYSNMASRIAVRHMSIHMTRADAPSSGLGELVLTVFSVLTLHKNRVTRRPSRPGTASGGIKKLT